MARQTTSYEARIRKLEAAQVRVKAMSTRATLTSKPMAEVLGVTWNVLRDWCNELDGFEQSGAFQRGGLGHEWIFRPRKTVTFLIQHFRKLLAGQEKKSRTVAETVGVSLPDQEAAPSLAELKDQVNLTITLVGAAERQKEYVLAADVAAFLARYNQQVLDGIMGVRTSVDPNGNLPASVRASVDAHLRSVATAVHAGAMKFIEECSTGAGLQQAGTG